MLTVSRLVSIAAAMAVLFAFSVHWAAIAVVFAILFLGALAEGG